MDVYDLGRIEVILGMPWLVAYNPKINWEKREVKIMRCPSLCGKNQKIEKSKRKKQIRKKEKLDKEVVRELVLKRFWRWKKVFKKTELEQMPV